MSINENEIINKKNIGEVIKNLRIKKGLSIRKLGELSNASPSNLSRIENGKREPKPSTLKKIAPFLDVSYEYLLNIAGFTDPALKLETVTKGILNNLIQDLLKKRIINDENNIPDDIMSLLISALKTEIRFELDQFRK